VLALGTAPFRGTRLFDIHAVVAWLDRHWAGGVPHNELFAGPTFCAAELLAEGFPVCVIVNPVGMTDDYPGFVAVRVAAWQNAPDERQPNVSAMRDWLARFGAVLEIERAGIVARFEQASIERLAQGSGAELTQVIGSAAQLAAQCSIRPL